MAASDSIPGQLVHYDHPHWEPLIRVLEHDLASWFMWMFEIELGDQTRLHAYKHVTTRRYLHLDAAGRALENGENGRYQEVAVPIVLNPIAVALKTAEMSPSLQALNATATSRAGTFVLASPEAIAEFRAAACSAVVSKSGPVHCEG